MKALLDTHVLLWWFGPRQHLSRKQAKVIRDAGPEKPLSVSDITLWEIATLYSLHRIRLHLPLRDWLERATAPPLVQRVGVSPAIAAQVATLPPSFHRDPADRIIVATAQVIGATVLTQDARIIASEVVATLA